MSKLFGANIRAGFSTTMLGSLLFQACLCGQTGSGTITGVIKDGSQLAIPGASVKIVNLQSGVATSTLANEAGAYRFGSIQPGTYRIHQSKAQHPKEKKDPG